VFPPHEDWGSFCLSYCPFLFFSSDNDACGAFLFFQEVQTASGIKGLHTGRVFLGVFDCHELGGVPPWNKERSSFSLSSLFFPQKTRTLKNRKVFPPQKEKEGLFFFFPSDGEEASVCSSPPSLSFSLARRKGGRKLREDASFSIEAADADVPLVFFFFLFLHSFLKLKADSQPWPSPPPPPPLLLNG